ncbi:MAG: polysaccharide biosynthesis/export family protein [Planctomycetota bacterium]
MFASAIALMCFCQPAIQGSEDFADGKAMPTAAYAASYESLMRRASTIAKQCSVVEAGSVEHKTLIQSLQETLAEAFDLRQAMQRHEIATTRRELDTLEKKLVEREKRKDAIIQEKATELLTGNDLWATPPGTAQTTSSPRFTIQPADILAVYIEGLLPYNAPGQELTPPPISKLNSGAIVTGYPIAVAQDGTIALPLVDPIKVGGMTIREAEEAVRQVYIKQNILRPEKARPMMTLVPREANKPGVRASNAPSDGVRMDLFDDLKRLIAKRKILEQSYDASHPLVTSIDSKIESLAELIDEYRFRKPIASPDDKPSLR